MFSISAFHQQYQTETRESVIGQRSFRFLVPTSLEPFLDPDDFLNQFPHWAKIWDASLVLAHRVAAIPPQKGMRWLELGAGLGMVGLAAAASEHEITVTEYDTHALNFIHANAHINACQPHDILHLDWMRPELTNRFDRIIGSELIYNEKDFPALSTLFRSLINPEGEILLASEIRQTNRVFLDMMQPDFHIDITRNILRSADHEVAVLVIRMRPKPHVASNPV